MPTWPDQLPLPQLDDYQLSPQAAFVRTDMDAGPARQRRRFTAAPTEIAQRFVLTTAQLGLFEAWYEHRVASGASWFDAPLRNGRGLNTVECRFTEPWQTKPLSNGLHEVTCRWETRARPVMSSAELTAAGVA